jgi:hypothetical protein
VRGRHTPHATPASTTNARMPGSGPPHPELRKRRAGRAFTSRRGMRHIYFHYAKSVRACPARQNHSHSRSNFVDIAVRGPLVPALAIQPLELPRCLLWPKAKQAVRARLFWGPSRHAPRAAYTRIRRWRCVSVCSSTVLFPLVSGWSFL